MAYCKLLESTPGQWEMRDVHVRPEFWYVREHLDTYIGKDGGQPDAVLASSWALKLLAWRAAFLFGTEDQISRAFEVCLVPISPGTQGATASQIAFDLATRDAHPFVTRVLWKQAGGKNLRPLHDFIDEVLDRGPARWGLEDYTPIMEGLMRKAPAQETRLRAAYCVARWGGDGKLGQEAEGILRTAAAEDGLAKDLLNSLERFGRNGWEEAGS